MKNTKKYPTDFYTPQDVMNILHLGRTQVYKLFNSSTFPAIKIGGSLRVDASVLRAGATSTQAVHSFYKEATQWLKCQRELITVLR